MFCGNLVRLRADLHWKTGNNYFALLGIPNIDSNQILALRRSSVLASTEVLHHMGSLTYAKLNYIVKP